MKEKNIILEDFHNIKITYLCGQISHAAVNMPAHAHEHCEIFIHLKGKLTICVEENFYEIKENTVRLYRSDELHYGKIHTKQMMVEWYQISIPKEFFMNKGNIPLGKCMYDRKSGTNNVFIPQNFEIIVKLLLEAFGKYEQNNPLYSFYFKSAVIKILCLINEKNSDICICDVYNENLKKIINIILSDFSNISSLQDLSFRSNYSESYIYKLFKKNLNITPYQFILDKKLTEAAKVLRHGGNVTEAGQYAGFDNYTHFITLFKKKFDITPKKYQNINRI